MLRGNDWQIMTRFGLSVGLLVGQLIGRESPAGSQRGGPRSDEVLLLVNVLGAVICGRLWPVRSMSERSTSQR